MFFDESQQILFLGYSDGQVESFKADLNAKTSRQSFEVNKRQKLF